jgi:thioredoxin-related protein
MSVVALTKEEKVDFTPTNKTTMLLVTNESCADCDKQKEVWLKFKNENTNNNIVYDQLKIDNAAYSDVADLLKIQGFPTVVGLSKTGELLYSSTGYHNKDSLEQATLSTIDNENNLKSQKNSKSDEQ